MNKQRMVSGKPIAGSPGAIGAKKIERPHRIILTIANKTTGILSHKASKIEEYA